MESLNKKISAIPFVLAVAATFLSGAVFITINGPLLFLLVEGKSFDSFSLICREAIALFLSAFQTKNSLTATTHLIFICFVFGLLLTPMERFFTIFISWVANKYGDNSKNALKKKFFSPTSMLGDNYAALLAWLLRNPPEKISWEWQLFHYRINWTLVVNVIVFLTLSILLMNSWNLLIILTLLLVLLMFLSFAFLHSKLMANVHEVHNRRFNNE